jgi:hypothetical protein
MLDRSILSIVSHSTAPFFLVLSLVILFLSPFNTILIDEVVEEAKAVGKAVAIAIPNMDEEVVVVAAKAVEDAKPRVTANVPTIDEAEPAVARKLPRAAVVAATGAMTSKKPSATKARLSRHRPRLMTARLKEQKKPKWPKKNKFLLRQ